MTNARNEELHATITARAELDRAFARQLVEEASSVMAKNLTFLLDQTQQHANEQEARFALVVKEAISAQVGPLMAEFRALSDAVATIERRLDRKRERLDTLESKVARIIDHLGLADDDAGPG